VAALDEHVGGDRQLAAGGRPDDRGVVADADLDPVAGRERPGEAGDQPELTQVTKGVGQDTALTIASSRPGKSAR
jgi:hypothetical protein